MYRVEKTYRDVNVRKELEFKCLIAFNFLHKNLKINWGINIKKVLSDLEFSLVSSTSRVPSFNQSGDIYTPHIFNNLIHKISS